MKKKMMKKRAFSMAEALVTMLVVALLVAASIPVFTKKHRTIDNNVEHGKWACKYINGELHSAMAKDIDSPLPEDKDWSKGCVFKGIGNTVKYMYVEVYGGGGGASVAFAEPWVPYIEHIKFGEPVPINGEYDIYMGSTEVANSPDWSGGNSLYDTSYHNGNQGFF